MGSQGEYELAAVAELAADNVYVGLYGNGAFTQNGESIHEIQGDLYLGYATLIGGVFAGYGSYELSEDASLSAADEFVGYDATGSFVQGGGSNRVAGMLSLGDGTDGDGTYRISGGWLEVGKLFVGVEGTGWLDVQQPDVEPDVEPDAETDVDSTLDLNGLWLYVEGNVVDRLQAYNR